jgi:hypothetical protein
VDAASASDRAGASGRAAVGICGGRQSVAQPGLLLTEHDVWPAIDDVGKIASDMSLDDAACRAAVAAVPEPTPVSCELGFPWYASDALPIALAGLGVTRVREAEFLRVRPDRSVSGRVSEYVLTLSGAAAAHIEQAAVTCDGVQAPDTQPPVYTSVTTSTGSPLPYVSATAPRLVSRTRARVSTTPPNSRCSTKRPTSRCERRRPVNTNPFTATAGRWPPW